MLKKTITFKNLDNEDVTEDFYFNLSISDLTDMEVGEDGLADKLRGVIATKDQREVMRLFKSIISASVGRRGEDNKRFEKSLEISQSFMETDAYSVLFLELMTDANAMIEFIKAVIPADLAAKLPSNAVVVEEARQAIEGEVQTKKSYSDYTWEDLESMPLADLNALVGHDLGSVPKNVLVLVMQRRAAAEK